MTVRRLLTAAVVTAVALGTLVISVVAPSGPGPAQAADLRAFEPGHIISDALFYDSGTMSAPQIQTFLNARGGGCTSTGDRICLKDYRQPTITRPADAYCAATYEGAENETAAEILAKVSQACGINPQVLIVTLQKEQSLITRTNPATQAIYDKALGFGCPDHAPCNAAYAGFFNQVYSAAHRLQYYAAHPTRFNHLPGRVNQVRFHPNLSCGSAPVYIENQATASLYNYTPYQPNAAALAAGYAAASGPGSECAAYGNRNFWNYFTDWFGPTTQRTPIGHLDSVTSSGGTIRVTGWALDPDTTDSINVHVYVDGKAVRAARADRDRPDVDRAHRRGAAHGFDITVDATAGAREVCVWAIDSAGDGNRRIGCRTVAVVNTAPRGVLDAVTTGVGTVTARGWAFDPDSPTPSQVVVSVDGQDVATVTASGSRPDVTRATGRAPGTGFSVSVPVPDGDRRVCVTALDTSGGPRVSLGCRDVTVTNSPPKGVLDSVSSVRGQIRVRGWAFDPDTTTSIDTHVYVDGRFARSVRADSSRPDVGQALRVGNNHGFDALVPADPGNHRVCVYAINQPKGTNPVLGCTQVTVVNEAPVVELDTAGRQASPVVVRGRVHDPDTLTAPVTVTVSVDGTTVGTTEAGPDGFELSVADLAVGPREICVSAADTWGGPPTEACTTVEVNGVPFGRVDWVNPHRDGGLQVAGWAIDPNTADAILVHVRIDGVLQPRAVRADVDRPDVEKVHPGFGPHHGFNRVYPDVPSGPATVCVHAIDPWGSPFPNPLLGCRTTVVP